MRLSYNPSLPEGIVTDGQVISLNSHRPSAIKAKPGTAEQFLEFIMYLVPDERERRELLRWCATLIARPERRIAYGLLLITETQGIGKTTLGDIMADLVGRHNTSFPSEDSITSPFNEWIYQKRLAVINEVYAGGGWKVYNRLKTVVTDKSVTLNRKYEAEITVENWLHFIACSNSSRPLKLAAEDRRWFVPRLSETMWPKERFEKLRLWLGDGGLGEIKYWAEQQAADFYVSPGAQAPLTLKKEEVVAESWSDAAKIIVDCAQVIALSSTPQTVSVRGMKDYARRKVDERVNETEQEIVSLMKRHGGLVRLERLRVNGQFESIWGNEAAKARVDGMPTIERNAAILSMLKDPM
jgi:hypothetical protein